MPARYGGHELRKKKRVEKHFSVTIETEGKISKGRTIDISEGGIQVPIRTAPEVGTKIKITIKKFDLTGTFEGTVIRKSKGYHQGAPTHFVGVKIDSEEYIEFIKKLGNYKDLSLDLD